MLDVPQVGSSTGNDKPDQLGVDRERTGAWRKGGLNNVDLYVSV